MINKYNYQSFPSQLTCNKLKTGERGIAASFDYYLSASNMGRLLEGTGISSPYSKEFVLKYLLSQSMNVYESERLPEPVLRELDKFIDISNDPSMQDSITIPFTKYLGEVTGRVLPSSYLIQHSILDGLRLSKYFKKNPDALKKLYPGLKLGARNIKYNHKIIDHSLFGQLMRNQIALDTHSLLSTTGTSMANLTSSIMGEMFEGITVNETVIKDLLSSVNLQQNVQSIHTTLKKFSDPAESGPDGGLAPMDNMILGELIMMWSSVVADTKPHNESLYEVIIHTLYRLMTSFSVMVVYALRDYMAIAEEHYERLPVTEYSAGSINGTHLRDTMKSMKLYIDAVVEMIELSLLNNPAIFNYDKYRPELITVEDKGFIEGNVIKMDKEKLNTLVQACYLGSRHIPSHSKDFIDSFEKHVLETYNGNTMIYSESGNDIYTADQANIIRFSTEKEDISEANLLYGLSTFLTRVDVTDYGNKSPYGTFRTFIQNSPEVAVIADIINMIDKQTSVETLAKYTTIEINDKSLIYFDEIRVMVKSMFDKYLDDNNRDFDVFSLHVNIIKAIAGYEKYILGGTDLKLKEVNPLVLDDYTDSFNILANLHPLVVSNFEAEDEGTVKFSVSPSPFPDISKEAASEITQAIKEMGSTLENSLIDTDWFINGEIPTSEQINNAIEKIKETEEDEIKPSSNQKGFRKMFGKDN